MVDAWQDQQGIKYFANFIRKRMKYILRPEMDSFTKERTWFELGKSIENEISSYTEKIDLPSVEQFMHVVRILKDNNSFFQPTRQFSKKEKTFIISSMLDDKQFLRATDEGITKMVANAFLEAIIETENLKSKPKDFDPLLLHDRMKNFFIGKNWI